MSHIKQNDQAHIIDPFADDQENGPTPIPYKEARPCSRFLEFSSKDEADNYLKTLLPDWTHPKTGWDFQCGYSSPLMGFGLDENSSEATKKGFIKSCIDFKLKKHEIPCPGDHPIWKYLTKI